MSKRNGKREESLTLAQLKGLTPFTAGDLFYGYRQGRTADGEMDGLTMGVNAVYHAAQRAGLTTAADIDAFLDQIDGKDLTPLVALASEQMTSEGSGPLAMKTES